VQSVLGEQNQHFYGSVRPCLCVYRLLGCADNVPYLPKRRQENCQNISALKELTLSIIKQHYEYDESHAILGQPAFY